MTEHTATPWGLCRHLESAEKDAACKCGYRGGIWGGGGNLLVCEMRNCDQHEGHDMIPVGSRAEQLANAAFIVRAVNSHDALVDKLAKVCAWLDRLAIAAETQAKDKRFATLSEAQAADAKNYRKTIADIMPVLNAARGETAVKDAE